jgi:hypothetical protein
MKRRKGGDEVEERLKMKMAGLKRDQKTGWYECMK